MMGTMSRDTIRDIRRRKFQNPDISTAELAKMFRVTNSDVREILGIRNRHALSHEEAVARGGKSGEIHRARKEERLKAISAYWAEHPEMNAKEVSRHFGVHENYAAEHVRAGELIPPDGYDPVACSAANSKVTKNNAKKRWGVITTYWAAHPDNNVADIAYHFDIPQKTVSTAIYRGYCKRPALPLMQTEPSKVKSEPIKPAPITEVPEPPKARPVKCTHCGAVLAQGAKYCHNCGTKYEDPRTQALRALEKLAQNISTFYPVTARDNAIAAITMITDYIKSTCEEV